MGTEVLEVVESLNSTKTMKALVYATLKGKDNEGNHQSNYTNFN